MPISGPPGWGAGSIPQVQHDRWQEWIRTPGRRKAFAAAMSTGTAVAVSRGTIRKWLLGTFIGTAVMQIVRPETRRDMERLFDEINEFIREEVERANRDRRRRRKPRIPPYLYPYPGSRGETEPDPYPYQDPRPPPYRWPRKGREDNDDDDEDEIVRWFERRYGRRHPARWQRRY